MKNMKISRRAFMAATAVSGAALAAGCSSSSTSSSTTTAGTNTDSGSASGEIPTITIGIQTNSVISDYKENELTYAVEEACGVNLEFYEMPSATAEFATKFSLLATNRTDMPDLIFQSGSFTKAEIEYYGQQGIIAPLNDYVADASLMPNFNATDAADHDAMLVDMAASDGTYYGMPIYYPQITTMTPNRLFVNQEWLDALGLNAPTTTDELLEVLRAFKTGDPNGNGKQDEIPLYGQFAASNYGMNIVWSLMNSFIFFNEGGTNNGLSLTEDGSTVIAPYVQDEWREGLEYMNTLYTEGLMSPAIFTDDTTQFQATLNSETPVVGFLSVGSTSNWSDAENNANYLAMSVIPPLAGPKGVAYTPYKPFVSTPHNMMTTSCENPEAAIRVMDYFFDREHGLAARFGVQDVHWSNDPAVTVNYASGIYDDNGDAIAPTLVYNLDPEINTWADTNNFIWRNINPVYIPADVVVSSKLIEDYDPTTLTNQISIITRSVYNLAHPEYVLPSLTYTTDENETITVPTAEIDTLIDTATAEFITGVRSLDDAGWNAYLTEMENLGLSTCIEIAQTAYDRVR